MTDPALHAVLEAPHDLALRRAYASSRSADPIRKRLSELDDALAGAPKPPARLAAVDERETLLARHGVRLEPSAAAMAHSRDDHRDGLTAVAFEHGFLSHVSAWGSEAGKLGRLAASSVYSLTLTLVEPKHFAALLDSPLLPRLRRLDLQLGHGVTPEQVLELLRSRQLGPLERLRLEGVVITPALAEQIGRLASLEALSLTANPGAGSLDGTSATALHGLTELRSLTLAGQDLDAKQLAKLLDAPFVAKLESFTLRDFKLGAKGCKLIANAGFEALTELDLTRSNVAQYGVEFAASPNLATLSTLNLDASKLGAKHLPGFLAKLDLPNLRVLRLGGLRLKEDGAAAIASTDAFTRCGVVTLSLAGNAIGDEGAEALAASEGLAGIRRVRLDHNGIRAEGVAALADSPLFDELELLDISNNKIQTKGATALAGSVAGATLQAIDINHNWIGTKGATALFGGKTGSEGLRALERVRLGYENNFEDAALDALSRSDLRLRTLLANTQGGPEAIRRFLDSPATERLTRLDVWIPLADETVAGLVDGRLGPQLHTLAIGTMGVAPERLAALDQRFAFSAQRAGWSVTSLEALDSVD